jgi:hypothetical protein
VRYEHLVQINDPARPDIRALSRAQLWRGLVLRAARPELFDPSIDETRTLEEDAARQLREVRRSAATLTERVEFEPETRVTLTAVAGGGLSGSQLEMRIEEPVPAALFVRFVYELRGPAVPTDAGELQAIRQAYYFADIDVVRHIRTIVEDESGATESPTAGAPHLG